MGIDKAIVDIIACPKCKGDLRLQDDQSGLICENCRLLYEIKEDIPNMLIDEAVKLESEN